MTRTDEVAAKLKRRSQENRRRRLHAVALSDRLASPEDAQVTIKTEHQQDRAARRKSEATDGWFRRVKDLLLFLGCVGGVGAIC